jgi:hypothetical protein
MSIQSVTLNVPQTLYEQIQRAVEKEHRSVDELLLEALTAVAPVLETASSDLQGALAQMAYLNDAALWQAARASMTAEQRTRLATLHDKQQRERLTPEEQDEEQTLLKLYRETLLVRAQAAVLLKQRSYEVSDPTQFQPLD